MYIKLFILCVSLLFCSVANGDNNTLNKAGEPPPSKPFDVKTFAVPKQLKKQIKDYRKSWFRLTGFEYSGLHWGQFVIIFANQGVEIYKHNYLAYIKTYLDEDEDEEDIEEEEGARHFVTYKPGTIFVKENYLASGGHPTQPSTLTIMIKRNKGYDSKNGDWEYIQSSVDGTILLQGSLQDPQINTLCAECHQNMAERDYIFSTYFAGNL